MLLLDPPVLAGKTLAECWAEARRLGELADAAVKAVRERVADVKRLFTEEGLALLWCDVKWQEEMGVAERTGFNAVAAAELGKDERTIYRRKERARSYLAGKAALGELTEEEQRLYSAAIERRERHRPKDEQMQEAAEATAHGESVSQDGVAPEAEVPPQHTLPPVGERIYRVRGHGEAIEESLVREHEGDALIVRRPEMPDRDFPVDGDYFLSVESALPEREKLLRDLYEDQPAELEKALASEPVIIRLPSVLEEMGRSLKTAGNGVQPTPSAQGKNAKGGKGSRGGKRPEPEKFPRGAEVWVLEGYPTAPLGYRLHHGWVGKRTKKGITFGNDTDVFDLSICFKTKEEALKRRESALKVTDKHKEKQIEDLTAERQTIAKALTMDVPTEEHRK